MKFVEHLKTYLCPEKWNTAYCGEYHGCALWRAGWSGVALYANPLFSPPDTDSLFLMYSDPGGADFIVKPEYREHWFDKARHECEYLDFFVFFWQLTSSPS